MEKLPISTRPFITGRTANMLRGSGMARDAKRFVAQPLAANDFLIQSSDEDAKVFY